MNKKLQRNRRIKRTQCKMKELGVNRLIVHRTSQHIYAQVVEAGTGKVLASASSLEKAMRESDAYSGNMKSATSVGSLIAERAKAAGLTNIAFDRNGFKYHGRIKALAEAAREAGLEF